jgi:uncharacterized membrane protein
MSSWPLGSRRFRVLALLVAWCGTLVVLRALRAGSPAFGFLVWNLFLAGLPALAAMGFARADARGAPAWARAGWFVLWLAFLPNAPYLLTDFVHLAPRGGAPLWYDIALMLSFSCTGLLLGYASIADVQAVVTRRFGARRGWAVALAALALCGFGIYLGRFQRWNSWDLVASPLALLSNVAGHVSDPGAHPRTAAFTLVWGAGLALGYVALRVLGPAPDEDAVGR